MVSSKQLVEITREWLNISMHRSMRERSHFARTTGLSMPQFSILMQLHYRGSCGISDLSERFEITNAAASQLVERLVQSGLIERAEDPHDRRAKQIQLSAKGKTMIEKGIGERFRWVDKLVETLDEKDRERAAEALTILTQAAQKLDQSA